MSVRNVHERRLDAAPDLVGRLVNGLATAHDPLWPAENWPAMRFDGPLAVGARGGHGPVRYSIEEYVPGRLVRFRFHGPKGFDGFHAFEVHADRNGTILRHVLSMQTHGLARFSWPFVFRPLHDALIEDSLDKAERAVVGPPVRLAQWSAYVRALRAAVMLRLRRTPARSSATSARTVAPSRARSSAAARATVAR